MISRKIFEWKVLIVCAMLQIDLSCFSQASLATIYTQDFGTTDISAWTDNSTIAGWYGAATGTFSFGHQDVTAAAPSNTGRMYSYECNGDNNQKLGSRASGGTGTIHYGVRLTNTSGSAISFLLVEFDWFQFSLAENGVAPNTITFAYQQGATVTSLTAGAWTSVAALDYTAPQSSGIAGTVQINGYPCTETGFNSACISVNIPAGEEIMLRWTDVNDANNDHHMGIDNLFVGIATDNTCAFILSYPEIPFKATYVKNSVVLDWKTFSEQDCDLFSVERSVNGVYYHEKAKISGGMNSSTEIQYCWTDYHLPISDQCYYRLIQKDIHGNVQAVEIASVPIPSSTVHYANGGLFISVPQNSEQIISVFDCSGRLVFSAAVEDKMIIPWNHSGFFLVHLVESSKPVRIFCP